MKTQHFVSMLLLICLAFVQSSIAIPAAASPLQKSFTSVAKPVLKWEKGGCYSSWCQTGWYSSPAVADIDGDGSPEVIGAAYSIFVLDGSTGHLEKTIPSGHDITQPAADDVGRTWPDVAVADVDKDGLPEIITAHSDGWVSVYERDGKFKAGWPKRPTPGNELRSLGVYDLDGNGSLEILVASTRSENQWYVYENTGILRISHWPQHSPDSDTNGYTAGCYNQNLAAGDLDGDSLAEIIGPNDTHYLAAFQDNGSQMRTSSIYGTNPDGTNKVWSRVGVHVSHTVDLRGYANCGTEHRPNFAHSAPVIVDVNGDGVQEAVVVGNVYNCGTDPYTSLYEIPYILKADRTRWKASGFDWTVLPSPEPTAKPRSEDYNEIENSHPNPVPADLDGDGQMEILYPSYDGRMHAYWLDRQEHGSWPYSVTKPGEGIIRFASEPVVADLDSDGQAEVIFTSWTEKGSGKSGKLHILSSQGVPIWEIGLPAAFGGSSWNGALAAPTLANIDADPELEVVLNTANSGFVAYDLPGTANAKVYWGTGRGSYQRSGSLIEGYLRRLTMNVDRKAPVQGDLLNFTFTMLSLGPKGVVASLTNPLPAGLALSGTPSASTGTVAVVGTTINWNGTVQTGAPLTIHYTALVTANPPPGQTQVLANFATASDNQGHTWPLSATVIVNGLPVFLPSVRQ
jgi:hypothetical protein